jgi:hypothetical protein
LSSHPGPRSEGDGVDETLHYRAWVTVGPPEMPFGTALDVLQWLNRAHPELSGIGCGGANDGQVYAVSCDADSASQARELIGTAFGHAISRAGLDGTVEVVHVHLERIW